MSKNSGMKGREIDFIPDRLIEEPVVFRGMTDTEVVGLGVGSIVVWVPICITVLSLFGQGMLGVGVGFGLAIITLLVVGKRLQVMKRRMPDGLHIVFIKKWLQEHTPVNFGYINTSQSWSIRRTFTVEKIKQEIDDE